MATKTSGSPAALLEAHGLVKHFQGFPVLKGVDLRVQAGETVVLYGPNGSGKTTLLRILATLSRMDAGSLNIAGESFEERSYVRSRLMYCGHGTQTYDDLEPMENLRFFLSLYGRKASGDEMRAVLERVNLWRFRHFIAGNFSAGMKRRLSFARAILLRPPLLMLDEPYTSLDTAGVDMVNEFLMEHVAAGNAVLLSNHAAERVSAMPHRRIRLVGGKLQEEAPHVA